MTDEVAVSGEALSVAEALLGGPCSHTADEAARQHQLHADFFDQPRPQQLGLGAKFVPHKNAAGITALGKLSKRLKRDRERDGARDGDEESGARPGSTVSPHKKQRLRGQAAPGGVRVQGVAARGDAASGDEGAAALGWRNSDSEEEEEGRVGVLGRGRGNKEALGRVVWNKNMLLGPQRDSEPGSKKRRKKKKKPDTGGVYDEAALADVVAAVGY